MKINMFWQKRSRGSGSTGMVMGMIVFSLIVSLSILAFPANGGAKDWPTKPITVIVPWAAGGGTDLVGRLLVPKFSEVLGVPVQSVCKPGASGISGTLEAVKSSPDGYTLFFDCAGTSSIQYAWSKDLPYNVMTERTFIARATSTPLCLMVPTSSPWKTMEDLVNDIRTNPSSISFGGLGGTGVPDICIAQFKAALTAKGVDVSKTRSIMYKGTGEVVPALAGGHVKISFATPGDIISLVSAGKIRVLAVTSASGKRYKDWPDVPTTAEAGFPSLNLFFWVGLSGPPGLPSNIVKMLSDAVREATKEAASNPEVIARFDKLGLSPVYLPPDAFRKFVVDEGESIKALQLK